MDIFQDALQLRACSLQVSCRCYALFRRPGEGAGRSSPLCAAVAQAEISLPTTGSQDRIHQSCVGQADHRTKLLVQSRNYGLLAPTETDGQRSALPRDLGACSRITGHPEVTGLGKSWRRYAPNNVFKCAKSLPGMLNKYARLLAKALVRWRPVAWSE